MQLLRRPSGTTRITALGVAPEHPVQLVLGLVVWSVWFVAIYAAVSLACAGEPVKTSALRFVGIALPVSSALVVGVLLRCAWTCRRAAIPYRRDPLRRVQHFIALGAAAIYLIAAAATAFVALPLAMLAPCR